MAGWLAKGTNKDCKTCQLLGKQSSFAKGTRVRIFEAFDCAKCEVTLNQPIQENENIIELYYALPQNYDGFSGFKIITASDIKFLFHLYEVQEGLWDDYYHRLMYFHRCFLEERQKTDEKKSDKKKIPEKVKKELQQVKREREKQLSHKRKPQKAN